MGLKKLLKKAVKVVAPIAGTVLGGALGGPLGAKIGGAIGGGLVSGSGAKKASRAQVEEQRNALMRVEGYQQPYAAAGTEGVNALMKVSAGDYSGFENSPDFLFAQKYGGQAVDRSAAGRGSLNSGNTLVAQQQFGQGLAATQLNNYRNALFQQAGVGQRAADNLTGATLGVGQAVGDARASGIVGQTNAATGAIDQIGTAIGDYYGTPKIKLPKNALMTRNTRQVKRAPGSYA